MGMLVRSEVDCDIRVGGKEDNERCSKNLGRDYYE